MTESEHNSKITLKLYRVTSWFILNLHQTSESNFDLQGPSGFLLYMIVVHNRVRITKSAELWV